MEISEIKKIPIERLLSHLGHMPYRGAYNQTQLMYLSPFREEKKPSFSVNRRKNVWCDLGTGKGGNVIDLAMQLNGNCTLRKAIEWLEQMSSSFSEEYEPFRIYRNPQRATEADIHSVNVEPLTNPALLSYLLDRGIPVEIGTKYCNEVHYSARGRTYFGLCFKNILGGIEIRNPYFKGCRGTKAPSVITLEKSTRTRCCCVFEGFMDFLSYQTMLETNTHLIVERTPCDCIVLNSTSILDKAIPFIDVYEFAYCYFDNDDAGINAYKSLSDSLPGKTINISPHFAEYNDLNDCLNGKKRRL